MKFSDKHFITLIHNQARVLHQLFDSLNSVSEGDAHAAIKNTYGNYLMTYKKIYMQILNNFLFKLLYVFEKKCNETMKYLELEIFIYMIYIT